MNSLQLKTFYCLIILCLAGSQQLLVGQVIAGSVPQGTSILYDIVDLSITEDDHDTTTYFDIDGDNIQDIRIWFLKGYPPADGPNMVVFYPLNNSFSFCTEAGQPRRTSYYETGDTLCTASQEWGTDSLYIAGCFGGWNCSWDTSSINNKFIAYRKTASGEIGWINVSMSLYSGVEPRTITFKINQLLVLYLGTGIDPYKDQIAFEVIPNPSIDGSFNILSYEQVSRVEIINAEGQVLTTYREIANNMLLPESKGMYIVRISNEKGISSSRRIIRL